MLMRPTQVPSTSRATTVAGADAGALEEVLVPEGAGRETPPAVCGKVGDAGLSRVVGPQLCSRDTRAARATAAAPRTGSCGVPRPQKLRFIAMVVSPPSSPSVPNISRRRAVHLLHSLEAALVVSIRRVRLACGGKRTPRLSPGRGADPPATAPMPSDNGERRHNTSAAYGPGCGHGPSAEGRSFAGISDAGTIIPRLQLDSGLCSLCSRASRRP